MDVGIVSVYDQNRNPEFSAASNSASTTWVRLRVDMRRLHAEGRLCLPCKLEDKERGKYKHKVRTEWFGSKNKK